MLDGADLIVPSLSASAASAMLGQSINVSFTVRNQGNATAAPQWDSTDAIYLSEDNIFNQAGDAQIGTSTGISSWGNPTSLAAGGSYARTDVPVTLSGVTAGRRYLFVVADRWSSVTETDETNNASAPIALDLTAPDVDLRIINPTVSRTNLKSNETVDLSWGVKNFGSENAAAFEWMDAAWLSSDNKLDLPVFGPMHELGDPRLTDIWRNGGLAAGASYTEPGTGTITIGVPNVAPGTWYIIFSVDLAGDWGNNSQAESNESNNVTAVPITISTPTLICG